MASSIRTMNPTTLSPFCAGSPFAGPTTSFHVVSDYRIWRRCVLGIGAGKRVRVSCKSNGGDRPSDDGEEPPESLFTKELKKRGISPGSLSEESNKSTFSKGIKEKEGDTLFATRSAVSTDSDKSLTNQREESMALNSEGLEGLFPRAKLLLTLGGTFFFAFGPLILVTVAFFSALYLYFGPSFVHNGQGSHTPPQYVDPYTLLQEEVFPQ